MRVLDFKVQQLVQEASQASVRLEVLELARQVSQAEVEDHRRASLQLALLRRLGSHLLQAVVASRRGDHNRGSSALRV